jgi:hypothetical protein
MKSMHNSWLLKAIVRSAVLALVFGPLSVSAAGLAPRTIDVGTSAPSITTSYTVTATTATTSSIASIGFQFCTTATGACIVPAGVVTTGATLTASSPAGFIINPAVNGAPFVERNAVLINAGTIISFTLNNVVNPSTPNQSYNVRITTYTGQDGVTGPVDTGNVALSTAQPVQLTGVTPEILVFCVGTSITGNCTTVSGSTIDFGDFSPVATATGTSVMQAQTNAANGYSISINGTTLASGVNTIPGLAAPTASTQGISQFGLNLRLNGTPAVGADPYGVGNGSVTASYNTPNAFTFNNGDTVATAGAPTNSNTYTSSYIVNIGGQQAAGVYTATMTYICTASF